jgi:hypothetical protein
MCFLSLNNVCLKHFLFQAGLTRYYDNGNYAFYKIRDMLLEFQRNLIFHHRLLINIQILNFMEIWRVESELMQSEKQVWRSKLSQFVILRTRLNSLVRFLLSFLRFCLKLLTLTLNEKLWVSFQIISKWLPKNHSITRKYSLIHPIK